jgi:hypothetical protein
VGWIRYVTVIFGERGSADFEVQFGLSEVRTVLVSSRTCGRRNWRRVCTSQTVKRCARMNS